MLLLRVQSFNTSHVTLYRDAYIWCNHTHDVSIHLMLLFIEEQQTKRHLYSQVSIHLMLLFIWSERRGWKCVLCVSIHLMLLFITYNYIRYNLTKRFQYISCYSLSQLERSIMQLAECFNTSHVTLYQCFGGQRFDSKKSVSIHLMLLFIFSEYIHHIVET